jgi:hypothetical protein
MTTLYSDHAPCFYNWMHGCILSSQETVSVQVILAEVCWLHGGSAAGLALPAQGRQSFRVPVRMLTSWTDRFIGNVQVLLEVAKEAVAKFEAARDYRQLGTHEESLGCEMKLKSLGVSSLQQSIVRQESRVLWLSGEEAPTRFFHVQASAHHCRQFIWSLEHEGHTLVSEDSNAVGVFNFFDSILGTTSN